MVAAHTNRAVAAVAMIAVLPAFLSFNFVYRFGVDLPYMDDWELVPLIQRWFEGSLSFQDLFAQHNEHRILLPRVAMLLVVTAWKYDTHVLMYVSWLVLLGTAALLLREHVSTFGTTVKSLALWLPVAWLLFTPRQHENLLWGWQIQFFMCNAGFVASMLLLRGGSGAPLRLALALLVAVFTSFTIAAGLGVWPAGAAFLLVLHFARRGTSGRRYLNWLVIWLVTGALSAAAYVRGFAPNPGHPDPTWAFKHPVGALRYVLVSLGSPFSYDATTAFVVGIVLILLVSVAVIAARYGALDLERAAFAAPLAVFALAFVALITVGRGAWGDGSAMTSRYTTVSLFFALAAHRACLAISAEKLRPVLAGVALTLTLFCLNAFFEHSYAAGWDTRTRSRALAQVLRDYRNQPDAELARIYPWPLVVRERAPILEKFGLSVFAR